MRERVSSTRVRFSYDALALYRGRDRRVDVVRIARLRRSPRPCNRAGAPVPHAEPGGHHVGDAAVSVPVCHLWAAPHAPRSALAWGRQDGAPARRDGWDRSCPRWALPESEVVRHCASYLRVLAHLTFARPLIFERSQQTQRGTRG